jgi:hypothetical protein
VLSTSLNYTFEEEGSALRLILPYKKHGLEIVISLMRLVVYLFVFSNFLFGYFSSFMLGFADMVSAVYVIFIAVHLIWMAAFLFEAFDLLWKLVGREVVKIENDSISVRHEVFGIGFASKLSSARIDAVFLSRYSKKSFLYILFHRGLWFFDFGHGKIGVNSGKTWFGRIKTLRLGSILDGVEAKEIVATIHRRFPHYKRQPKQKPANRSVRNSLP